MKSDEERNGTEMCQRFSAGSNKPEASHVRCASTIENGY